MVQVKVVTIPTNVVPPGGWKFSEPPITLSASTFDKLVQLLADHREANHKPPGNPRQEIMDQIGGAYPHLAQHRSPRAPLNLAQQAMSLAYALKQYIQNGGSLVTQNEANIRAGVCMSCHNNTANLAGGGLLKKICTACTKGGLVALRSLVLAGRKTPIDNRLKDCAICGCDLALKVWVPKEYFDPDGKESNKWPSFCWMK